MSVEPDQVLPYSIETVPPQDPREAVVDFVKFAATNFPREEVKAYMSGVDASRIVRAMQGMPIETPLSGLELLLADAVEHHMRQGLIRTPLQAIGAIESVRQDILRGEIIPEPRFPKPAR